MNRTVTFLTSSLSHIPQLVSVSWTLQKKDSKTFIKCSKRQLIPVAVIKSNIYNIFYKIYQCVFYVIYKLDVLLESGFAGIF